MKRHMLRDAWEIHKVKLAACRATPELKEERERLTERTTHFSKSREQVLYLANKDPRLRVIGGW